MLVLLSSLLMLALVLVLLLLLLRFRSTVIAAPIETSSTKPLTHPVQGRPYEASFYEKLRELPDPEIMAPKDKIVYVTTETGRYNGAALTGLEPGLEMELPRCVAGLCFGFMVVSFVYMF